MTDIYTALDKLRSDLFAESVVALNDARVQTALGREDLAAVNRGQRYAFNRAAYMVEEARIAAMPRCNGSDGYSESWDVTCPGGCGAVLHYQRFLHVRGAEGRFTDEDSVLHECHRCGFDVDDVEPDLKLLAASV